MSHFNAIRCNSGIKLELTLTIHCKCCIYFTLYYKVFSNAFISTCTVCIWSGQNIRDTFWYSHINSVDNTQTVKHLLQSCCVASNYIMQMFLFWHFRSLGVHVDKIKLNCFSYWDLKAVSSRVYSCRSMLQITTFSQRALQSQHMTHPQILHLDKKNSNLSEGSREGIRLKRQQTKIANYNMDNLF